MSRREGAAARYLSTPAGLDYVLQKHGKLPWARVIEGAIRLAEDGCRVTPLQHALAKRELQHVRSGAAASWGWPILVATDPPKARSDEAGGQDARLPQRAGAPPFSAPGGDPAVARSARSPLP